MAELDPLVISASRVDTLARCGVSFRYKYVDKVPGARAGVWALWGSVFHKALERWGHDRTQSLFRLMEDAWFEVTQGTQVFAFLKEYRPLSREAIRLVHAIRVARPDIKKPKATKQWKDSAVHEKISDLKASYDFSDAPWVIRPRDSLTDDYEESLVIARRYQVKWETRRPVTIATELGFDLPWRGFQLRGFIDALEPLVTPAGECVGLGATDYKSEQPGWDGEAPPDGKHYRQLVIYAVAVELLQAAGKLPTWPEGNLVGIDYIRLQERQYWRLGPDDFDRLEYELHNYAKTVREGAYLPAAKGAAIERCDYPEICCQGVCSRWTGGEAVRVEVDGDGD